MPGVRKSVGKTLDPLADRRFASSSDEPTIELETGVARGFLLIELVDPELCVSTGRSSLLSTISFTTPIGRFNEAAVKLATEPRAAKAAPERGSDGPISVPYSRERNLILVRYLELRVVQVNLQSQVVELYQAFVPKYCCCKGTKPNF